MKGFFFLNLAVMFSFLTDCSKAVLLLQLFFVYATVVYIWRLCHYLFLISPSFDVKGRPCFVIVTFPMYLQLYIFSNIQSN